MEGKVIIFSAPSGSGKSTIVSHLLKLNLGLEFSTSATCRLPRGEEKDGIDYFFFSLDQFNKKIDNDEFVEWEEVYPGCCYGTLKVELEKIWSRGHIVVFDVDVIGGQNLKKIFKDRALALFVKAPSIDVLKQRLISRNTDSEEKIAERIAKAEYEMTFAPKFDKIIINDKLEQAYIDTESVVRDFIKL